MLHGDISNQRSFVIGVRCEDCLLKFKNKGVKDKFLNLLKGKSHNAEVDRRVLSLMRYIYENTDYTVSLVVDKENYTDELRDALEELNVPYNQVGLVLTNISEVTMMLNTGELSLYVDSCYNRRALVNSQYAVDVDTFNTMLRRKVRHYEVKKQ